MKHFLISLVAGALLVYNSVACVVLASARPAPATPALQLAAAVLHGLIAVGLLAAISGHLRRQDA